jgi:hypothetical protein
MILEGTHDVLDIAGNSAEWAGGFADGAAIVGVTLKGCKRDSGTGERCGNRFGVLRDFFSAIGFQRQQGAVPLGSFRF